MTCPLEMYFGDWNIICRLYSRVIGTSDSCTFTFTVHSIYFLPGMWLEVMIKEGKSGGHEFGGCPLSQLDISKPGYAHPQNVARAGQVT